MFEILTRLFRKDEPVKSGASARNRLQLVLIQDRAQVCPELLDSLRTELVQLISRYMIIDEQAMHVELERKEGAVALAASIPVINIRRVQPEGAPQPAPAPVATLETPVDIASELERSAEIRKARLLKRRREALRKRRSADDETGLHGAD